MKFRSQINRSLQTLAVCLLAIVVAMLLTVNSAIAATELDITVYRDPDCSCCGKWIERLTAEGFNPEIVLTADVDAIKHQYGVPDNLTSCHTAIINGYVVEGHVPPADIKRLIAQQPNVVGIAVPGMPIGVPGMESEEKPEDFQVLSFDRQGNTEVFDQYSF